MASLPSWERGLKFAEKLLQKQHKRSLPSWERGLKYAFNIGDDAQTNVAPLVGAWIEITVVYGL